MTELHEGEEHTLGDGEIEVTRTLLSDGKTEYLLNFPARAGHYWLGPINEGAATVTVDENTAQRLARLISKHHADPSEQVGEEFLGALNTVRVTAWDDGYRAGWLDSYEGSDDRSMKPHRKGEADG